MTFLLMNLRTWRTGFVLGLVLLAGPGLAAGADGADAARRYLDHNQPAIVAELMELLAIPNVSSDLPNIQRNADHLVSMLQRRGVEASVYERETAPFVFGELKTDGARRTLLFYCHFDGQPVDPSRWSGTAPFSPVIRDEALENGGRVVSSAPPEGGYPPQWRIYGRSASDDKSPIVAILTALDALREANLEPSVNLKFFFEGEEEAGSPHLAGFLEKYGELLKADALIIADGPRHTSGRPTVVFGVRGITTLDVTVYGPLRPLHSGHFGNWAPNPAMMLSRLLASMKDGSGRVLVDGFYEDVAPLNAVEQQALDAVPPVEKALMQKYAIGWTEGDGLSLAEAINLPSLNVRGLASGWVGDQARTIVPATATAAIDLRLVKGNDPARQSAKVVEHIRRQGYTVVREEPSAEVLGSGKVALVKEDIGYPAQRTSMELPICREIVRTVAGAGEPPVQIPTLGGSVPLYLFEQALGVPIVGLPIVNGDNNQHSPNENLRLGEFFNGIEIFAALMRME